MKPIGVLRVIIIVCLLAPALKGQTRVDSIVQSILPIRWSINFNCYIKLGPGSYNVINYTWSDSVTTFDSALISDSSISFISHPDWQSNGGCKVTFILDTLMQRISVSLNQQNIEEDEGGIIEFDTANYSGAGTSVQALLRSFFATWAGPTPSGYPVQTSDVGGWVTIGNTSPPDGLEAQKTSPNILFSSRFLSNNRIRFSFAGRAEVRRIRIFDLLGRMRDEIPIMPQTTSIEYASNRLAPGMYIATLEGNAIKFIVP